MTSFGKGCVLLDRDGTIIVEREYLSDPSQVELIPGAVVALGKFHQLALKLAVVTNQSGVGRGYFDMARVDAVHQRMTRLLAREGVRLDAIYVCPHIPADHCGCRKPRPGLAERAATDLEANLRESIVIGDKHSHIEMGRNVGAITILVKTGYGAQLAADGYKWPTIPPMIC
jgi:D-glycero-D-manno-heptose 1,7-bisphosphate phosphatase